MSFPLIPATLTAAIAPAALALGKQVVEQLDFAHLFTDPQPATSADAASESKPFEPINGLRESAEHQIGRIRDLLNTIQERLQHLTAGGQGAELEIRDNGFGDLQVNGPADRRAEIEHQLNQDAELKLAFQDLYRYAVQAEPDVLAQAGLALRNPSRFTDVRVGNQATEPSDFSLHYQRGQLVASHD